MSRRTWWHVAGAGTVLGLVLLGSCATEPCACPPVFESVTIVSGNKQHGTAGQPLALPIVVRADQQAPYDPGLQGRPVYFLPQPGSGSVSSSPVNTDGSGLAQVIWTVGPDIGEDTLIVRLQFPDVSYSEAIFTATVQ